MTPSTRYSFIALCATLAALPRHIAALEFVAAAALICVFAVVLYMVFTYRPV